MRKTIIILLVAVVLVLTGCGTTEQTQQATDTASTEMDEITQWMAGTILLQSTDYSLDADQQSSLLLLWKGYNAVIGSSTSAEEEIEAVEDQIKAVFTKEQLSAIEDMGLTTDTLTAKLAAVGVDLNAASTVAATEEASSSSDAQMPSGNGEMPQGGGEMPQGGGMQESSGDQTSSISGITGTSEISQEATLTADSLNGLTSRTTNTALLNAVIQYLNEVVNQ